MILWSLSQLGAVASAAETPLPAVSPYPSLHIISVLFISVISCATLTGLLLRWNRNHWGVDAPDGRRKHHDRPILRLGGLPLFITLLLGFVYAAQKLPDFLENWWPLIITNVLIFAVGFIDDLRPMGAKVKLVGQIGTAAILYSLGVSIDILSNPFGDSHLDLGWWSLLVTVLWLVAIPNFINLIDGMDGLASGFGVFLCGTLAVVGHFARMPEVVLLCVVMGGALGGFLLFNLPPAKIFLGDGGAYLIGFFVASVSLHTSNKGSVIAALLVMFIALGVPILDTVFAIVRRAIRGVPIFRADSEHIHHRLMLLGFSKAKALVALYTVCLVMSLIGISVFWNRGLSLPIAGAAVCLLALGAARYLGYIKSWRDLRSQLNQALARRREMLYAATYAKTLEWEVERCATKAEFIPLLLLGLHRVGLRTHAEPGYHPVRLSLILNQTCTVYVPNMADEQPVWLARADLFATPIGLAVEKWGFPDELQADPVVSAS